MRDDRYLSRIQKSSVIYTTQAFEWFEQQISIVDFFGEAQEEKSIDKLTTIAFVFKQCTNVYSCVSESSVAGRPCVCECSVPSIAARVFSYRYLFERICISFCILLPYSIHRRYVDFVCHTHISHYYFVFPLSISHLFSDEWWAWTMQNNNNKNNNNDKMEFVLSFSFLWLFLCCIERYVFVFIFQMRTLMFPMPFENSADGRMCLFSYEIIYSIRLNLLNLFLDFQEQNCMFKVYGSTIRITKVTGPFRKLLPNRIQLCESVIALIWSILKVVIENSLLFLLGKSDSGDDNSNFIRFSALVIVGYAGDEHNNVSYTSKRIKSKKNTRTHSKEIQSIRKVGKIVYLNNARGSE